MRTLRAGRPGKDSFVGVFSSTCSGWTLIELVSVVVIVGILATIGLPLYSHVRDRAEALRCAANLKTLYAGVSSYVQDNQTWPKIRRGVRETRESGAGEGVSSGGSVVRSYEKQWVDALFPYGVTLENWHCPSMERRMKASGVRVASGSEKIRLDYAPTQFEDGPLKPYERPGHPWFVERGAPHASGPQFILTDGSVLGAREVFERAGVK